MTLNSSWPGTIPRPRVGEGKMPYTRQLSLHFNEREFLCRCGGLPGCSRVVVHPQLVEALEEYRSIYSPHGVRIISGYRCTPYNKSVGGARYSQHLYGCAVDLIPRVRITDLRKQHLFSGFGIDRKSSLVVHVDVRHLSRHNTPGINTGSPASPHNPAVWYY